MTIRARIALLSILFAAALLVTPGNLHHASAHAFLSSSDPAANAVVATAPTQMVMTFSERLQKDGTSAWLVDHAGTTISGSSYAITGDYEMTLTLPTGLPNGTYSVVWKNISADDGHPASGYVPFTIGTSADAQAVTVPSSSTATGAPQWLRTTGRWFAFLGLFSLLALWPTWVFVLSPAVRRVPGGMAAAIPIIVRISFAAVILAVAGNLFALFVQAAEPGGNYLHALNDTIRQTRYGRLMALRLALIWVNGVLLSYAGWVWPWRKPELTTVTLVSSLSLAIPFSFIAHSSAQTGGRGFAIGNDMLHLIGAGLWAGGVAIMTAMLFMLYRRIGGERLLTVIRRAVPRFSMVAIAAWICIAATGAYSFWIEIGGWNALRHSDYGNAFIIKMALAAVALLFGAFHFLTTEKHAERRFLKTLSLETVAIIGIVLATGWLTSIPPAREVVASTSGTAQNESVNLDLKSSDGIYGTLTISPGIAGPNTIILSLIDASMPSDAEAVLRLTSPDPSIGEQEFDMTPAGPGQFQLDGSQLSIAGSWSVTAIVRKIGVYQWQADAKLQVFAPGTDLSTLSAPPGMTIYADAPTPASSAPSWHLSDLWIPLIFVVAAASIVIGWWIALGRQTRRARSRLTIKAPPIQQPAPGQQ